MDRGVLTLTDASLPDIAKHAELEELDLRGTAITDAGLPALDALSGLKKLDLRNTSITAQAVDCLRAKLLACEIVLP